ncbi:MAG TPA: GerMN domain-containing protein [Terriglobia bacterium]|nr:GerMN domain-containing protein [Terriglobia bacterium]
MPRHIKIGLIILGIGLAVALGFFVDVVGRVQSLMRNDKETEENPFKPPTQPLYAPTDPPMAVKIFFPAEAGDVLLTAEDQTIFKSSELGNRARQILQKVQEGPHSDKMVPSLPKDTKVQDVFISGQGTAFVDFSNTMVTNHPGGVLNELGTIYSIVDSLTYNLPEIKQVKILIGGVEKETLAGHCLLLLPLDMDLSMTNVMPREEKTAELTK